MPLYRVIWTIDFDADTAEDAAEIALDIQRDSLSDATVFEVINQDTGEKITIDLEDNYDGC